jgi:hypothetical protein
MVQVGCCSVECYKQFYFRKEIPKIGDITKYPYPQNYFYF